MKVGQPGILNDRGGNLVVPTLGIGCKTYRSTLLIPCSIGLESFLTVFVAHGIHSLASANKENINDDRNKVGPTLARNTHGKRVACPVFSSIDGLDAVLENDPWFIRNNSLILKNEDGLSAIATKIGTPLMLDSYTSDRCIQLWGRSSYARALIEDECPKNIDSDMVKNMKKPGQASRGVPVVENDVDLGTNNRTSNLDSNKAISSRFSFSNVEASSTNTTPIVDKIDKYGKLIIDGKESLVDDEDKPLKKVAYSDDHDSDDEVTSVDNDMARFMASNKVGFGTNCLIEQWRDTYENVDYDYDPYDDDMYKG
ncbi:hypothetical protein Tco_0993865 [Tanacetum coccineum]